MSYAVMIIDNFSKKLLQKLKDIDVLPAVRGAGRVN